MFVGIDVGRSATKVALHGKTLTFPSVVGEGRDMRIGELRDYQVEFGGQRYFVGHLAEESYSRRETATESKLHEETRILFLTAVAAVRHKRLPGLKGSDRFLLAGGGALRLGRELKRHFALVESVANPVEANALGYRRFGMVRHANASR